MVNDSTQQIDLFSLYVLFSQYRWCDNTLEYCFFQISSHSRAYLRIIYEKTKGGERERETGRRGPWERGWKRGISKKWNNKTNSDLQGCKRKTQQLEASNEPPCNLNGRKKGYMKIMKELWDETGYAHLNFTEQNLRDQTARL